MDALPGDLVLAIAEQLDVKSALKLAGTCKHISSVIRAYERSVVLTRMKSFLYPPVGNVLSSELCLRRPLRHGSFEMMKELERRESAVEDILTKAPVYINIRSPAMLGDLDDESQIRLSGLLKRALAQCDHIADIAANAPCKPKEKHWYLNLNRRYWEIPDLAWGFREKDPYTNYSARPYQREHIQSLPLEEVVMLLYLVTALSLGFLESMAGFIDSDPAVFERTTMFEDSVLRHGSWFIWAHAVGGTEWQRMSMKIVTVALVELSDYESGREDALPGLRSALLERFKELTIIDEDTIPRMFTMAKRIVTGKDPWPEEDPEEDDAEGSGDESGGEGGSEDGDVDSDENGVEDSN